MGCREYTTKRKASQYFWERFLRIAKRIIVIVTTRSILKAIEWLIVLNILHVLTLSTSHPYNGYSYYPYFSNEEMRHKEIKKQP